MKALRNVKTGQVMPMHDITAKHPDMEAVEIGKDGKVIEPEEVGPAAELDPDELVRLQEEQKEEAERLEKEEAERLDKEEAERLEKEEAERLDKEEAERLEREKQEQEQAAAKDEATAETQPATTRTRKKTANEDK